MTKNGIYDKKEVDVSKYASTFLDYCLFIKGPISS